MVKAVGFSAMHGQVNAATRAIASTLGVLVGIGSIDHGVLECLQGTRSTPGLIVNALGPGYSGSCQDLEVVPPIVASPWACIAQWCPEA